MPTLTTSEVTDMRALLSESMTATAEHRNNPTGAAATSSVATGSASAPTNPISSTSKGLGQDYPVEKLFLLKETFTLYTAFETGDYLVSGGVTYAVRAAQKSEISLGVLYYLVLEENFSNVS